jgi:hypothetical protein
MNFILYCVKRMNFCKYFLLWAYVIFSLMQNAGLGNYNSICMCKRRLVSMFQLLNQLTDFHKMRYTHCATGGHSNMYVVISNNL